MPVSGALRRLFQVRTLEEEQHRISLESALTDLRILEKALVQARVLERRGRAGLRASAAAADPSERVAALVETRAGARHAGALIPRIAAAEEKAARLRRQYLDKRMERRQAETLIRTRESLDAVQERRSEQRGLDNWFSSRAYYNEPSHAAEPSRPPGDETLD